MAQTRKSVIKEVTVEELMIGDRLLVGIYGYKEHILFNQGTVLDARAIRYIKERLADKEPRLAAEQVTSGKKAVVDIKDKSGRVIVNRGGVITDEAVAPLLKEGFTATPIAGSSAVQYSRPQTWNKNIPWHISEINPFVKIETMVTVNDEVQEQPEESSRGKVHREKGTAFVSGKRGAAD